MDEVNRIVPQLIRHGKVVRPGLGVQVAPDHLADELGINGVVIVGVQPGSPAAEAGLRPPRRDAANRILLGDVITAVGKHPVQSVQDLFAALGEYEAGATMKLTLLRDGAEQQVDVGLESIQ